MSKHQNVGSEESPVCKHNQRGFCRNGSQCLQPHNNNICQKRVCRDQNCRERHPKECKYYTRNSDCKWKEECVYKHKKSESKIKIDMLETKVEELEDELKQMKNNLSEIMVKMLLDEEKEYNYKNSQQDGDSKEYCVSEVEKENFNCNQCKFRCNKEVTLNKHKNTKHESHKCDECGHNFKSSSKLGKHKIRDHLKAKQCDNQSEKDQSDKIEENKLDEDCFNFDDVSDLFQKETIEGGIVYACNLCDEGFDKYEEVQNHIVSNHQSILLRLRKDLNEEEEKEIDLFMKEFDEDGKRISPK